MKDAAKLFFIVSNKLHAENMYTVNSKNWSYFLNRRNQFCNILKVSTCKQDFTLYD